jgi:hypothetical protein
MGKDVRRYEEEKSTTSGYRLPSHSIPSAAYLKYQHFVVFFALLRK